MGQRVLSGSAMLLVLLCSGVASAASFTVGNHPQLNEENIFLNTTGSGAAVFGVTGVSQLSVSFSSTTDILTEPTNGAARIAPVDGLLNQFAVTVPNGVFSDFIFNAFSGSGTATVVATVNQPGGGTTPVTFTFDLTNGSNFLTVVAGSAETFARLEISAPGGFADLRQPRISGAELLSSAAPVPEPASLMLLGSGLVCVGNRLRRKKASGTADPATNL